MRATETLRIAIGKILAEILGQPDFELPARTVIEPPREASHGDLATNIAMLVAKQAGMKPRDLAGQLAARLPELCPDVEKAEAAGPGFCNVTFSQACWRRVILDVCQAGKAYGNGTVGKGKRVLLEYVSANPTGPLHVGHGRGAAVGDSLARLLRRAGYEVDTEYYINDAGRQMRLLGLSVWLRVQEQAGRPVEWPEDYYRGSYIADIARQMLAENPALADMPEDKGKDACYERAMHDILNGIKADLAEFRVEHRNWFSEKSLVDAGAVDRAFATLAAAGHTFEQDNALWFATSKLGDDRDRVLRKSDGSLTYFASDIAYHHDKYDRGYDWLIDIWGADHHGYIPRMRAAIASMGKPAESFDVVLIQLVNLLQEGKPISMSTRAGKFETLEAVVREVGADAARFLFLSRKSDSPLDFDLDLARQRNMDNPVYYVQYGHARVCAVLRRAAERGLTVPDLPDEAFLAPLDTPEDMSILRKLAGYGDMLESAAGALAVHHVSHYLGELAGMLHSYYAKHQVLAEDEPARSLARLALLRAVGQVLASGLDILGVTAPESM